MNLLPASVLVIEKHPILREALCMVIADQPDLKVAAQATSGAEALKMVQASCPDMVVMAVGNPGLDDLESLALLRKVLPGAPILALTSNEVQEQEQAVLQAGASLALTKSAPRVELIEKLRELWKKALMKLSDANTMKEANGDTSK